LKRALWWSLFGNVHLLHSSQTLVEDHFTYVEQGGGVGCVAEVLLGF